MRVPELHAIVARNSDEIAEATFIECRVSDPARGRSENRIASLTVEVDTAMASR